MVGRVSLALSMALSVTLSLGACAGKRPARAALGPPPLLPEQRRAARFTPLPEWYWEPVFPDVRVAEKSLELPVVEASVVRVEGATRVWDELGTAGRERLCRDGLVVLGDGEDGAASPIASATRMGAFYMDLREQRVPYVVTLDALAYAVHVAFERALAEVDDTVLAPALDSFTRLLETRLTAEAKGAGVELGEALKLARGIDAVARTLASEGAMPPPADLGPEVTQDVAQEVALVTAHAGLARSPLLDVPIDYARFAVPRQAGRPGAFRALSWLATAPLLLVAESEVPRGGPAGAVGIARSRLHARTAMILARVSEREVDPAIYEAWSRIARLLAFVWGPADDVGPSELAEVANAIGVTLDDPKNVSNVVTVDRVRHRAAHGREPLVFDGAGATGRAGIAMRLFGGHVPADSVALSGLARSRESMLPSTLDLAVWLGAPEARAALHEGGGDGFAGYDAALARAVAARPAEDAPSRHASVYGSLLDATMTWMAPPDDVVRANASAPAARAAIESALAAWTYARHDGAPLSRARPGRAGAAKDFVVTGAPLPAFVEVAPEVIARLVAALAQLRRGLGAIAQLPATSPAMVTLAEVDDLLRASMRIATSSVNDDALSTEDLATLASMPARLARLEDGNGDEAGRAMVPLVAEVYADPARDRVVSSAAGLVEPALVIVREPESGRLVLAVGAHVAHHELVESRAHRSTDASYRARFGKMAVAKRVARTDDSAERDRENRASDATIDGPIDAKSGLPRAAYISAFRMVR